MRKVTPQQLEPGMILAKPILRGTVVFLSEGMALTESTIDRIATMDIEHIFIEGASEQPIPLEEALSLLDERFKNSAADSLMVHIKNIVREHITNLYE